MIASPRPSSAKVRLARRDRVTRAARTRNRLRTDRTRTRRRHPQPQHRNRRHDHARSRVVPTQRARARRALAQTTALRILVLLGRRQPPTLPRRQPRIVRGAHRRWHRRSARSKHSLPPVRRAIELARQHRFALHSSTSLDRQRDHPRQRSSCPPLTRAERPTAGQETPGQRRGAVTSSTSLPTARAAPVGQHQPRDTPRRRTRPTRPAACAEPIAHLRPQSPERVYSCTARRERRSAGSFKRKVSSTKWSMNHRPASTNRQNSRDGSGPPAKALLSFKGAGYYSHAGEAKREAVNTGS